MQIGSVMKIHFGAIGQFVPCVGHFPPALQCVHIASMVGIKRHETPVGCIQRFDFVVRIDGAYFPAGSAVNQIKIAGCIGLQIVRRIKARAGAYVPFSKYISGFNIK